MTGTSYDANGNLLTDTFHTYTWDANWGNVASIDSTTLTFDALGRMVEQNNSGAYTQILYGPGGTKLALMNGLTTLVKAYIPLPGGTQVVYGSTGLSYYRHPDWLGSSRFASTPSRTKSADGAYAPFGEPYGSGGGPPILAFSGQNQDTATGLYDFLFREYAPTQGRWISPDPAGLGAVDPANPQSWNRYAYVTNSPLNRIDPLGLCGPGRNGEYVCHPLCNDYQLICSHPWGGDLGTPGNLEAGWLGSGSVFWYSTTTGPDGAHLMLLVSSSTTSDADDGDEPFGAIVKSSTWADLGVIGTGTVNPPGISGVTHYVSAYNPSVWQQIDDKFNAWRDRHSKAIDVFTCLFAPGAVNDIASLDAQLKGQQSTPTDTSEGGGAAGAIWVNNINTQRYGGQSTVGSASGAAAANSSAIVADYVGAAVPCFTR